MPKRLAAIITDRYHNTELTDPVNAARGEGHEVTIIAVSPKHLTEGVVDHQGKRELKADTLIGDVSPADFDALLIPGGGAPEQLRMNAEVLAFVRSTYAAGKPIAAICHAAMVLISAEVVAGKNMTCVPIIGIDLKNAGAVYLDEPLVVDRNIITSRTPADMDPFCGALVRALK